MELNQSHQERGSQYQNDRPVHDDGESLPGSGLIPDQSKDQLLHAEVHESKDQDQQGQHAAIHKQGGPGVVTAHKPGQEETPDGEKGSERQHGNEDAFRQPRRPGGMLLLTCLILRSRNIANNFPLGHAFDPLVGKHSADSTASLLPFCILPEDEAQSRTGAVHEDRCDEPSGQESARRIDWFGQHGFDFVDFTLEPPAADRT